MTSSEPTEGREVRLFPSTHINSEREAEQRATASFLSMVSAVSEFGRTIIRQAGGPAGRVACFAEVPYALDAVGGNLPESVRPDGVISCVRGKTRWTALVEVKVGRAPLDPEQTDKYHRLAKQQGCNALITVSNQAARGGDKPPVPLDGRRLRGVPALHFSWERLLSEAQMLSRKKSVSDPDQAWMLQEWIRYIDDSESRIVVPPDLGPHWSRTLKAARTGVVVADPGLSDVADHWVGYLRKLTLRLRAKLGVEVKQVLGRAERASAKAQAARVLDGVQTNGALSAQLRVPNAAGDIGVDVFLHSRTVRYSVTIKAPAEGRQLTRLNWLARQLRRLNALHAGITCEIAWSKRNLTTSRSAQEFAKDPGRLALDAQGRAIDKDVVPRRFCVAWATKLNTTRGRSSAPVLESVSRELDNFYRQIVEELVAPVRKAPRLEKPLEPKPSKPRRPTSVRTPDEPGPSDTEPAI